MGVKAEKNDMTLVVRELTFESWVLIQDSQMLSESVASLSLSEMENPLTARWVRNHRIASNKPFNGTNTIISMFGLQTSGAGVVGIGAIGSSTFAQSPS